MRCDSCQHWKKQDADTYDDDWRAARAGFGRCIAIRMLETIEEEATKGLRWPGGPTIKWDEDVAAVAYTKAEDDAVREAMVYTQDGSSYRADVYTGPDFYCARFASAIEAGTGETA